MKPDTRGQKLLEIITHGLARYASRNTQTQLGNREEYVGMSDIGGYMTCPRMAIMNKLHPQNLTHDRRPLLTMQRGHWFEDGIADALKTLELPLVRQLEIAVTHNGTPIKAHLDFVLTSNHPRPTVRILEVKSCQKLPDCLYAAYETQVYGQVGLLTRYWEERVFNVREETGQYRFQDQTFPEIAHHLWNLNLPYEWEGVDIEAWVLCLSMTDAKVFGPYVSDAGMMDAVLGRAEEFWSTIHQVKDGTLDASSLKTTSGFNPLCEHCLWNADCPKFIGNDHPELSLELEELETWKSERASLDGKIKTRETSMKDWYANISGTQDGWIQSGHWRFKASEIPGRRTLDKDSLVGELIELFHDGGMDDVDVPALLARHEKVSAPSTRLFINKTSKRRRMMGYRSDVGLALTQAAVQTLNEKLNALDKMSEAFSVITDFFAYVNKHFEDTESGSEVYLWEYVKWYEEFPDVGFIEHLLAELDWSDFLFIRIGEELGDIDTRGSFWANPFDLGISRGLTINIFGS